jgi:hypothetical protein
MNCATPALERFIATDADVRTLMRPAMARRQASGAKLLIAGASSGPTLPR